MRHSLSAITITLSLVCFAFSGPTLGHEGSAKDHYNRGYWTGCQHAGGKPNASLERCVKSRTSGSTQFHYVQCGKSPGSIFKYEWKLPRTKFVPKGPYDAAFRENEPFAFTASRNSFQALFEKGKVNWELFSQDSVDIALPVWDAYAITNQGFKPGVIEFNRETDDAVGALFSPDKKRGIIAWDAWQSLPFARDQATIKQFLDAGIDGGLYLSCE